MFDLTVSTSALGVDWSYRGPQSREPIKRNVVRGGNTFRCSCSSSGACCTYFALSKYGLLTLAGTDGTGSGWPDDEPLSP